MYKNDHIIVVVCHFWHNDGLSDQCRDLSNIDLFRKFRYRLLFLVDLRELTCHTGWLHISLKQISRVLC